MLKESLVTDYFHIEVGNFKVYSSLQFKRIKNNRLVSLLRDYPEYSSLQQNPSDGRTILTRVSPGQEMLEHEWQVRDDSESQ